MISSIKPQNLTFTSFHKITHEKSPHSSYRNELIHTTHFFRHDKVHKSNEFICDYVKRHIKSDPLNIVSMGCSYGEEVYSYVMMMDYLGKEAKIIGFDLSSKVIDEIKNKTYNLSGYECEYLTPELLTRPFVDEPTDFQREMRKQFAKNFELINPDNKTFKIKDGSFENCHFFQGDVVELDKYFKGNSQDIISCNYVLYHLTDREKINTLNQIYNTLKPNGILCVSPSDEREFDLIKYCGFVQVSTKHPWMFKKPSYRIWR